MPLHALSVFRKTSFVLISFVLIVAAFLYGQQTKVAPQSTPGSTKIYTNTYLGVSLTYPAIYDNISSPEESSGNIRFGTKDAQDLSGFSVTVTSTSFTTTADWINAQPKGGPSRPGFEPVLWMDDAPTGKALIAEYVIVDQDGKKPIYGRILSGIFVRNEKLFKITFHNQSLATGAPTIPEEMVRVFASIQ